MSGYMEKILKASGQTPEAAKRVLELNATHPVITKLKNMFEKDRDNQTLKDYSRLLMDMAIISEGGKVDNPSLFSKMVGELMSGSLE